MYLKAIILSFLLFVFSCQLFGQMKQQVGVVPGSLLDKYQDAILTEEGAYDCGKKFLQGGVLDSNLKTVFTTVVLSGNDLVRTGTAASVKQNKESGVLSFNYAYIPGSMHQVYNFGITAKTGGSIFNLFSPDSWVSEAGVNFGYTHISKGKQFFQRGDCEKVREKRHLYLPELSERYKKVLAYDTATIAAERRRIQDQFTKPSKEKLSPSLTQKKAQQAIDSLDGLLMEHQSLTTMVAVRGRPDMDSIRKRVREDLTIIDYNFNQFYGYKFWWFDSKLSLSNAVIDLPSDKLTDEQKKLLSAKNYLSASLYGSVNFTRMDRKTLFFLQMQGTAFRGSFLNNPLVEKATVVYDSERDELIVQNGDKNKSILGKYSDVEKAALDGRAYVYAALLVGKKKEFGFSGEFQLQGRLNQIRDVRRPNTFSLLVGPIYRVENEKDISVATISLKFGVVNAVKHSHVFKDHFGITLEAGVPFKWYIKGKEAEKKVME